METIKGLSSSEVLESLKNFGPNTLTIKKRPSFWQKYWEKFDDPIITILLMALGVNVIFTFFGKVDWFECVGIFISILLSTFVSAISEFKNEETFRNIQEDASRIKCKVYRENHLAEICIDDIVVGDAVLLQAGDLIPADGIVISGKVKVDQSTLNGENKEIEKECSSLQEAKFIDFWDKHSLFRGTVVCSGQCVMKVSAVGDKTVYGRLNQEAQTKERESPLQVKLFELAKGISRFGYIGAILVVCFCMFQQIFINNSFNMTMIANYFTDASQVISDIINSIIVGIIVIVVSVPEGLPLMIAIVCSLNMKKMMSNNVLVRKLIGIETAGSINILFSDKTGTITKGKLSVINFTDGNCNEYNSFSENPSALRQLVYNSVIGNCSSYISDGKILGGNATDKALLSYITSDTHGIKIPKLTKHEETLFSSEKKYSSTRVSGDFSGTLIKGAPEKILKNCRRYYDKDGIVRSLPSINALHLAANNMAERSIRVIAIAVSDKYTENSLPDNMILVGLAGIRDELRPDVKSSVDEVNRAGIQVVMITGDKRETAVAIAKEAGIITGSEDIVLSSDDLQKMTDHEIGNIISKIRVIARALPTDKSRLVRIAQQQGLVTGMTGDGVNDLSALKNSDVGFAMGSGCDVSKEAGDIVILDDNFSSIKRAVLYGRTIYRSIKKFITFQLTINIAAVTVSILGPLIGIEKPLTITQMLWINLCMDTLAAIAFGGEPALKSYMLEKPKNRNEKIMDKRMLGTVIIDGLFIFFMSLLLFLSKDIHLSFRSHASDIYFYTGYFNFFMFSCIFNAFNARCDGIDLAEHISLNKPFLFIMASIFVIQLAMTYFGGSILRTEWLMPREWIACIMPALLIIPVDIFRKIFSR